jgi:chromosome condensin MukBEF MukE localization factor
LTVKLGVFSLWNGQQAFHSRPARISFTEGMIMLDSVVRARSSSKKAVERLIREGNFVAADSRARKRELTTYPQLANHCGRCGPPFAG